MKRKRCKSPQQSCPGWENFKMPATLLSLIADYRRKAAKKIHQNIRWVRAEELEQYEFCLADMEVVERLTGSLPMRK